MRVMPSSTTPERLDEPAARQHVVGMISESEKTSQKPERKPLEDVILSLCAETGAGKSICPTDAAKAFASARGEEDLAWQRWLSQVRAAAVGLARQGRLVIYRKGKPADPDDFRGVYRLGLPRSE